MNSCIKVYHLHFGKFQRYKSKFYICTKHFVVSFIDIVLGLLLIYGLFKGILHSIICEIVAKIVQGFSSCLLLSSIVFRSQVESSLNILKAFQKLAFISMTILQPINEMLIASQTD